MHISHVISNDLNMSSFCMKVKNAKWGQEEGIWNDKRCNYGNRRAQSRQKGQKEGIICFTLGWHQQSLPPRRRLQNGNPKVLTTDDGRRTDWPGSKKEGTGGHKKGITGNCNLPFYPFSCKFGHQLALLINSYFLKFYASAKFLKGFQPRTLGSIDQTLCAFLIKQKLHCPLLSGCLNGHLEETRNLKKRVLLFSIFLKEMVCDPPSPSLCQSARAEEASDDSELKQLKTWMNFCRGPIYF